MFFRKLPLLGGADLGKYNAIENWGGLLSSEQKVQECDARDDDSSNTVDKIYICELL